MSGGWQSKLDQIKDELAKEDETSQETEALKHVEEAEVPERFREAAPDVFGDDDRMRLKAEQQSEEDKYLAKLNIVNVYRKLTGNETKHSGGENEKLVFCPTSGHNNTNTEAACINTAKGTWVCYGQCEDGGGIIDMVAAASGMPFGKQLKGADYAKAKQKTLEDFCGWIFEKTRKGWAGKSPEQQKREEEQYNLDYPLPVEEPVDNSEKAKTTASEMGFSLAALEDDDDLPEIGKTSFDRGEFGADSPREQVKVKPHHTESPKDKPAPAQPEPPKLTVISSPSPDDPSERERLPEISNIFEMIPKDTPLYEFMYATQHVPQPREFLLFRGLQLLAMSAGAYVRGEIAGDLFRPALLCMFVAGTGVGKSQSARHMNEILEDDVYKWRILNTAAGTYSWHTGIMHISDPGSGEYLLHKLSTVNTDSGVQHVRDVTAHLDVDELSHLIGKAAVKGSSLLPKLLQLDNTPFLDKIIGGGSLSSGDKGAVNANVIMSTGVQPEVLGKLLGQQNIDNGFLARFDLITGNYVEEVNRSRRRPVDVSYAQELYGNIAKKYLNGLDQGNRKLVKIGLADDCKDEFDAIDLEMQRRKQTHNSKSRFDLKFQKYCLLFAINAGRDEIISEDLHSAKWIMDFLERTTNFAANKTVTSEGNEMEDSILRAVATVVKTKGYATEADIKNRSRAVSKGWDMTKFYKKIEELAERGELVADPRTASRGPKTKRWTLHKDKVQELQAQAQNEQTGKSK